ncbi:MAG: RsmD family RNA methyltransferase [Lentimicrobiaceae bacterium]|jgi:16S rRNA (guanine(966)-N(2))-methyltransferase RsmD
MRIISGSHKGRVLHPPEGLPVRPTTDMAKESLFNILNNYIDFEEVKVLDLFAGTGNISLEFASRNATMVTSVDVNGRCIDYISKMAAEFKFINLSAIRANVFAFLARPAGSYDVIFADPPYDLGNRERVPELIFENRWLVEGGWFILEHDKNINFKDHPYFSEERRYGRIHFTFFRKTASEATENPA